MMTDKDDSSVSRAGDPVLHRLHTAAVLCTFFLVVEVIGGYVSGSLAVLSDAAHLLADLASFGVAITAGHLANLPSSAQHTYGLRRTESLAALLSMVSLALVSIGLAWEAVRRLFFVPREEVDGLLMSFIAFIGVLVNIALAVVLGEHHVHLPGASHDHSHDHHNNDCHDDQSAGTNHHSQDHHHHGGCCDHTHDHSHDLEDHEGTPLVEHLDETELNVGASHAEGNVNLRAAYLHVMGDLAQSTAVLIAGLVIYFQPTWTIVDPIATLLFCALVFCSTLPVIRRGIAVLLEEVPPHISWKRVHDSIAAIDHVSGVHDLHIWSISDGRPGLSVHCFVSAEHATQAMREIQQVCKSFGISHATIQIQDLGTMGECITCTDENHPCVVRSPMNSQRGL